MPDRPAWAQGPEWEKWANWEPEGRGVCLEGIEACVMIVPLEGRPGEFSLRTTPDGESFHVLAGSDLDELRDKGVSYIETCNEEHRVRQAEWEREQEDTQISWEIAQHEMGSDFNGGRW